MIRQTTVFRVWVIYSTIAASRERGINVDIEKYPVIDLQKLLFKNLKDRDLEPYLGAPDTGNA